MRAGAELEEIHNLYSPAAPLPEGDFTSENGTVTSLLSRQMFQARQSEEIIEESFAGSLPAFVAAFTSRKKLSTKEIKELKKIIENNGGEKE